MNRPMRGHFLCIRPKPATSDPHSPPKNRAQAKDGVAIDGADSDPTSVQSKKSVADMLTSQRPEGNFSGDTLLASMTDSSTTIVESSRPRSGLFEKFRD